MDMQLEEGRQSYASMKYANHHQTDEKVLYGRNLFSFLGAYLELVPAGNFYSHMVQHLAHQGSRMLWNISFFCIFTKSAASLCHKYTSAKIMM